MGCKGKELIFVGYDELTKGYRLIDPQNPKKIVKGRSVVFFENEFRTNNTRTQVDSEDNCMFWPIDQNHELVEAKEELKVSSDESDSVNAEQDLDYVPDEQSVVDLEETEMLPEEHEALEDNQSVRRSTRVPKPKVYPDYVTYFVNDFSSVGIQVLMHLSVIYF